MTDDLISQLNSPSRQFNAKQITLLNTMQLKPFINKQVIGVLKFDELSTPVNVLSMSHQ